MQMISQKDVNSAELETLRTSKSPTTVITANGEVETHKEAAMHFKELDIFLTMRVLEDTPAVKNHISLKTAFEDCNTENFVPIVVPGLSTSSSSTLPSSTSITLSRQENDHPTSTSSSSTSPTMSSSNVSSESVARQERRDPCGIDSCTAAVSS